MKKLADLNIKKLMPSQPLEFQGNSEMIDGKSLIFLTSSKIE